MSILSKLQALLTAANTTTGESDTTLTDAMQTLVDGYGISREDFTALMTASTPVSIDFSDITTLRKNALANSKLNSTIFPDVATLSSYVFDSCAIPTIVLPSLTQVSNSSFRNTGSSCNTIDLGENMASIDVYGFYSSTGLSNLILRKSSIVTLYNVNAFGSTPFASNGSGGTIYVPQALISDYQAANNWTTILGYENNSIVAIEGSQYENYYADGTPIT